MNSRKVPANFVPAAAVIQWGQVLFHKTGRKECSSDLYRFMPKKFELYLKYG